MDGPFNYHELMTEPVIDVIYEWISDFLVFRGFVALKADDWDSLDKIAQMFTGLCFCSSTENAEDSDRKSRIFIIAMEAAKLHSYESLYGDTIDNYDIFDVLKDAQETLEELGDDVKQRTEFKQAVVHLSAFQMATASKLLQACDATTAYHLLSLIKSQQRILEFYKEENQALTELCRKILLHPNYGIEVFARVSPVERLKDVAAVLIEEVQLPFLVKLADEFCKSDEHVDEMMLSSHVEMVENSCHGVDREKCGKDFHEMTDLTSFGTDLCGDGILKQGERFLEQAEWSNAAALGESQAEAISNVDWPVSCDKYSVHQEQTGQLGVTFPNETVSCEAQVPASCKYKMLLSQCKYVQQSKPKKQSKNIYLLFAGKGSSTVSNGMLDSSACSVERQKKWGSLKRNNDNVMNLSNLVGRCKSCLEEACSQADPSGQAQVSTSSRSENKKKQHKGKGKVKARQPAMGTTQKTLMLYPAHKKRSKQNKVRSRKVRAVSVPSPGTVPPCFELSTFLKKEMHAERSKERLRKGPRLAQQLNNCMSNCLTNHRKQSASVNQATIITHAGWETGIICHKW